MGSPWLIPMRRVRSWSVRNDLVKIPRLSIDQVILLSLHDSFLFGFCPFRSNIFRNVGEKGFEKPIQKDAVIKVYCK
jgi:hypothetical protein